MLRGLSELAPKFPQIGNVRGIGLMAGIEFVDDTGAPDSGSAAAVQQACIPEQLLTLTCGPMGNVVRLIPALVVTEDEMATGLNRFEAALTAALG
jgi:4-aminobutyrate aminotransferase